MAYQYAEPSPFPPSYEGNPWAYGFGLAGDLIASSICLAMLLTYLLEDHRAHQASRLLNLPAPPRLPRWSVFWVYRTFNINVLLFVVMRALPDSLWMLLWGEVSEPMIQSLLLFDLTMDGAALLPLSTAAVCWAWGRQSIPQSLLSMRGGGAMNPPSWALFGRNGVIVALVFIISLGVTIGKVNG